MARNDALRAGLAMMLGAMSLAARADNHAGVVPGSYRLMVQDAHGRQVEATAGNPGRIEGVLACPITLFGQAQVLATSSQGALGLLRVSDGAPPASQHPRPDAAIHSSP